MSEREPIDEQRAQGWLDQQRFQLGQAQAEDHSQNFGNVVGDARKRIMGEWDAHMNATQVPEVVLFQPMNPGHTTGDARKRISQGGGIK